MTEDSRLVELGKSIRKGDRNAVKQFFVNDNYPLDTIILPDDGCTALHFAILAGKYEIAEDLIKMMSETDLEKRTTSIRHTSLTLVAYIGTTHLARCIVQKNSELLTIADNNVCIPVTVACNRGRKEMTRYLYSVTPPEVFLPQNGNHGIDLMMGCMQNKILVLVAMFEATKQGIVEFVPELLKVIPPIIFPHNDGRNVFMIAIQYRQENIFNLLYGIHEESRLGILNDIDSNGNNVLHVAGEIAPPSQLARIFSPALQMQRELQWFKEVERIVPEWCKESKNGEDETAYEVFSNSHKELVKEGEKWMRDTASSFSVVGTLIITIMFAAAFTLPGGNAQDGLDVFGNPNIALRPGRFSRVLAQEVDHWPFHSFYFYCSNDG
ncbi:hypothetical protein SLEP1_g10021 [Rubroshorea leprosula]|uniref:PGG domain-containing protein n=1 Tax=Rubroshorea leprosula TaxID=152421 RepID=A0AAV5IEQ4_9ROSI|nr:hypothetical protein SLEP1_g10021 [Rubroshorea leprosula]